MTALIEQQSRLGSGSTGTDTVAIEAEGVYFAYAHGFPVLRGVDLRLRSGEVAMLLGRSGSGKTTLLRVLKGLIAPQRGRVRWLAGADGDGRTGAAVAYIPQTLGLVRSLTARDNVLSGALARAGGLRSLIHNFSPGHVLEADVLIREIGLEGKEDWPVFRLSGGERQRIAIARALMQHPRFILADEFVSQLDPVTAEDILTMMRGVAASGVGWLVTTHETDVVEQHADRLIAMRDGVIVADAPARELDSAAMIDLLR
jgi:phosphonate transport system ATP-binding protein